MRGPDEPTSQLFGYLLPEQRMRPDHPLRAIRHLTDAVFAALSLVSSKIAMLVYFVAKDASRGFETGHAGQVAEVTMTRGREGVPEIR